MAKLTTTWSRLEDADFANGHEEQAFTGVSFAEQEFNSAKLPFDTPLLKLSLYLTLRILSMIFSAKRWFAKAKSQYVHTPREEWQTRW